MKKNISKCTLALLMGIMFMACSKKQNCECGYTEIGGDYVTVSTTELEGSKKKIKEACDSKSKEWADVNGSCVVK